MQIIYGVCSWGLGHATRSLPIMRKLISEGHELAIISNGRTLELLKKELGKKLVMTSAYDPFFHGTIFNVMAGALSQERQEEIGINKQQSLHDNIVDEGLGKLYKRFLDRGGSMAVESGITPDSVLLKGKAFASIIELSDRKNTDLIVAGRFGHHRDDRVKTGSNCEAIVRYAKTNVLITS